REWKRIGFSTNRFSAIGFSGIGSVELGSMKWWILTAAALCGFFGALLASAEALPQSAPGSPQSQADSSPAATAAQGIADSGKPSSKTSHPNQTHRATAGRKPAS